MVSVIKNNNNDNNNENNSSCYWTPTMYYCLDSVLSTLCQIASFCPPNSEIDNIIALTLQMKIWNLGNWKNFARDHTNMVCSGCQSKGPTVSFLKQIPTLPLYSEALKPSCLEDLGREGHLQPCECLFVLQDTEAVQGAWAWGVLQTGQATNSVWRASLHPAFLPDSKHPVKGLERKK